MNTTSHLHLRRSPSCGSSRGFATALCVSWPAARPPPVRDGARYGASTAEDSRCYGARLPLRLRDSAGERALRLARSCGSGARSRVGDMTEHAYRHGDALEDTTSLCRRGRLHRAEGRERCHPDRQRSRVKLLTEYARPVASAMPCRLRNPSPSRISNAAGVAFEVGHDAIRLEGWVRMRMWASIRAGGASPPAYRWRPRGNSAWNSSRSSRWHASERQPEGHPPSHWRRHA